MNNGARLHFSSVIVSTIKGAGALIFILILNSTDFIDRLLSGDLPAPGLLIPILILTAIIALIFGFNLLRWSRTYTYFEDASFVVERRLIMQSKTTVKLSSIASVNLQQGIFERLFGTYRLQLDINSAVSANKTDYNLVFSKDYALELKKLITNSISGEKKAADEASLPAQLIFKYPLKRVIRHCVLSTPLLSIFVSAGIITGFAVSSVTDVQSTDSASSFFWGIIFIVQLVYSLISPFFKYYDFTISRQGDKVIVSYGLVTKRQFTLPLSKTNAIVLRQPLLARMFGMYYGEILNIGMGDEEKKGQPFFCLLCDADELHYILSQVAPEFVITAMPEKSPAMALIPTGFKYGIWASVMLVAFAVAGLWYVGAAVFLFMFLCAFLSWRTKELILQDTKLTITSGIFTKRIITVPYGRLQNIKIKSGPIGKPLGLRSGEAVILSELSNKNNFIGYFPAERFETIMNKMTEQRGSTI